VEDFKFNDLMPDFAAAVSNTSSYAGVTHPPPKVEDADLPDDGVIRAGEMRCFCLDGTTMDIKAKVSPSCVSNFAYLNDACGHAAVPHGDKPSGMYCCYCPTYSPDKVSTNHNQRVRIIKVMTIQSFEQTY